MYWMTLTLIQPLQCSSVWDKFGTAYYASPNLKGRQRLLSYKKLEYYQFTPSVDRMSTHIFVWHKKMLLEEDLQKNYYMQILNVELF